MKNAKTLDQTLLEELADVYDAEKQIVKALPKMAKAAMHEELRRGFEEHLEETEGHVERLEQVFEKLGSKAKGQRCKGMAGLLEEGEERIKEKAGDAALICAAQKVEHYEIAAYGTLKSWAERLGNDEVAELLGQTLDEETATDEKLTELAEEAINPEASEEGEMGGARGTTPRRRGRGGMEEAEAEDITAHRGRAS